jgi:NADH-quinone oxidoreductase subunit B
MDDMISKPGNMGVLTTPIKTAVEWARTGAMWPLLFGLACCAIEYMSTQASSYDLSRFGISRKMAPVVRQIYDQMASPKWAIAMGACAATGCNFNNYALVAGVDEILPVDVYIAGCPPRPEQLIHGILTLHEQIQAGHPGH